jgi:hypothetical protein
LGLVAIGLIKGILGKNISLYFSHLGTKTISMYKSRKIAMANGATNRHNNKKQ